MWRFLTLFVFLALPAIAQQGPAPSTSPGSVRYLLPSDEQSDWNAIGRLNLTGRGFCTAALIAPDLVLTAAHCVIDNRLQPFRPDKVHFVAGFRMGAYADHSPAAAITFLEGFVVEGDLGQDVALIRLAMPLEVPPLPVGAPQIGEVSILTYGRDRSQALSRQEGCVLFRLQSDLLRTTCEGAPGGSGAPILQDGKIVGVVSAVRGVAQRVYGRQLIGAAVWDTRLDALRDRFDPAS